ncbi:H-NS family nucleoid-associated regulatory protein [Paraburkholderia sediminicola]|uniref:H-NS family nucleoid-associated regulatory protein n=1 Tax=Paraburkholderia sediminicola TaxID=458836 RepID=UPI0038B78EBB
MPTLEQIQAKLKKLQAQADVLIARKAQVAVNQIRDLMLKHGLTTADIEAKAKARRAARGLNGHAASGKTKATGAGKSLPKYRDHKTGATWTGHGRAPAWIAAVKDRTQFLIEGASELKSAAKAVVTHAKAGSKGQPKGAQPPKYLNPKTGATWSGRGPAPAWLATVRDRTKFLIDGAAATQNVAAKKIVTAEKAVASKAAAKKGRAATKKVAAKKGARPAAKKAAVKKTAVKKTAAAKKAPGRKAGSKAKAGATSAAAAPQTSTVQAAA